eukprot:7388220-Prymnesium_polylepis.1
MATTHSHTASRTLSAHIAGSAHLPSSSLPAQRRNECFYLSGGWHTTVTLGTAPQPYDRQSRPRSAWTHHETPFARIRHWSCGCSDMIPGCRVDAASSKYWTRTRN